jgi:osmotically-inducible protein OsmY
MKIKLTLAAMAAVFGTTLLGCTQESKQDYSQAGDNLSKAADKMGDAMSKDASAAGQKIKEESAEAGAAGANVAMTTKVKSALGSAEGIDAEHIDVDTVGNTVTLKGSVDTTEQKAKAEQIARNQAGSDYTIDNQLKVGRANVGDSTKNQ